MPGGSASSSATRTDSGSTRCGHRDLEVLRLARRARRGRVGVADLRVRVEAGREGHRHVGAAQRPLERPLEVAARGEAQPAPLGVADAELLHGRVGRRPLGDALTCLSCHGRKATGPAGQPFGPAFLAASAAAFFSRSSLRLRMRSAASSRSSRVASASVGAVPPRLAGRNLRSGPVSGS